MKSVKNIVAFPKLAGRAKADETAFLPAALEIVETPASPVGRGVAVTIIAIFCFSVGWASFSHIDIVASASGKIVPSGGTKVIQPFEMGIVRAIHVRDGQQVSAGDILVELDPTINESDRDHIRSDLIATQLEIARLKAGLADMKNPVDAFHPPSNATPAQVDMHRDYLIKQPPEFRATINAPNPQLE